MTAGPDPLDAFFPPDGAAGDAGWVADMAPPEPSSEGPKPEPPAQEPLALALDLPEPAPRREPTPEETAGAPDYARIPGLPHPYRMAVPEPFPPARAILIAEGVVLGEAKTAGSKTGGAAGRWTTDEKTGEKRFIPSLDEHGRPKTFMKDSSGTAGKTWRSDVRDAVNEITNVLRLPTPIDRAIALEVTFFAARTKGHYGSGKNAGVLKDSARLYPSVAPDAIKMMRAFEDALNTITWRDDSRNVDVLSRKRYTNGPPRAQWRIWALPDTVGELRALMQAPEG